MFKVSSTKRKFTEISSHKLEALDIYLIVCNMVRVAVIGAGVIGLSTAYVLKRRDPSVDVTILTKALSPYTCSDVAAGIWFPYVLRDTPMELQIKWSKATLDLTEKIFKERADANDIGIAKISGHELFDYDVQELPEWHHLLPNMRLVTKEEMNAFPKKYKSGYAVTTYIIEGSKYIQWLMKRFLELGGDVKRRTIESIGELSDSYDLVINCSGFGARKLCGDTSIEPVRGQVMRVKAPWVKTFFIGDLKAQGNAVTYIIPNKETVVLGGTAQVGNFNEEVSESDKAHIIRETQLIQPDLINALYLKDAVGLRPSRPSVRLEREDLHLPSKTLKVIHNYGHGGAGITVHWGCALDAVDLAMTCINEIRQAGPVVASKL